MEREQLAAAVAAQCRALPAWPDLKAPPGYPDSLALCIVDAIWSMGVHYQGVKNVIKQYEVWLAAKGRGPAKIRSAWELADDIESVGGDREFADAVGNHSLTSTKNGVLKASAAHAAALALSGMGVETTEHLRKRHSDPDVKAAWTAVPGQRSGISWHYLCILAGVDDVKADRMICRFVALANGAPVSPDVAYRAVRGAHELLTADGTKLTLRALDNAIWRAESGNG